MAKPTSAPSPCALCGENKPLCVSHIIPAFVIRWLKDTSATGHIRRGDAPNVRTQDGLKRHLLCEDCEQLLGRDERTFTNELFTPFNNDDAVSYPYSDWLLRFCTSVSWRILLTYWDASYHDRMPEMVAARDRWRNFLLGRAPHPGDFRQHILPLYPVGRKAPPGTPENINRFLLRDLDAELVGDGGTTMTYAKLGRFAVFGEIGGSATRWREVGETVNRKGGVIRPSSKAPSPWMLDFLFARARENAAARASMSDAQKDKIAQAVDRDPNRVLNSDTTKAMMHDARLFGRDAIVRKRPPQ